MCEQLAQGRYLTAARQGIELALTITPPGHTFVGACREFLHLEEIIADHFQYLFLALFPMLTYIRTYAIS